MGLQVENRRHITRAVIRVNCVILSRCVNRHQPTSSARGHGSLFAMQLGLHGSGFARHHHRCHPHQGCLSHQECHQSLPGWQHQRYSGRLSHVQGPLPYIRMQRVPRRACGAPVTPAHLNSRSRQIAAALMRVVRPCSELIVFKLFLLRFNFPCRCGVVDSRFNRWGNKLDSSSEQRSQSLIDGELALVFLNLPVVFWWTSFSPKWCAQSMQFWAKVEVVYVGDTTRRERSMHEERNLCR